MKRSTFIQQIGLVTGAVAVAPSLMSSARKKTTKLVILHTNDTHSNIDPFPANHPKFPNMGGVSNRSALIEKIRLTEQNVILLDAGDIFQGTPYFNKFKGELEMKVMTEMKYDVATLGNHDFDIGMEGYKKAKSFGSFKVVNANYGFDKTCLKDEILPHTILKRGGLKIGVFGVGIDLNGLVPKENFEGIEFRNPIQIAQEQADLLKKKKCDYIICLSHLGYEYPSSEKVSDTVLAQSTSGIDLIIGGHTHTFLDQATEFSNSSGQKVMVNQVGYGGLKLGRIDVTFSGIQQQNTNSSSLEIGDSNRG